MLMDSETLSLSYEKYYGAELKRLRNAEEFLLKLVKDCPAQCCPDGVEPILYCKSRIKEPGSMIRKLKEQGLPTDSHTALESMHDALGLRIVCSFLDDVYRIAGWLSSRDDFTIVQVKDYIAYPKPNGYRSLHLILSFPEGVEQGLMAEVQLRTIAMDSWAALEHQIKYKKKIGHEKTIRDELKRCADETASVDLSMQTLRELINNDKWN